MMNYCTYFDKNYLSRGLALYNSLVNTNSKKFRLFIIAFDLYTFNFFQKNKYNFIKCIYFKDFEDKELIKVKKKRTKVEYLWTCTPSIILFLLKKYKLKNCIYLDADLYFFSNYENIFKNKKKSIFITSHNYHPNYDQTKTSGKYCVQFLGFKNNKKSLAALNWWRLKCLEWCFNRVEDGKFGDQKYLDEWTKKFKGVEVLKNLGLGVAPWNLKRFNFSNNYMIEKNRKFKLIFYHFHDLQLFNYNKFAFLGSYDISSIAKKKIYLPYLKNLIDIEKKYHLKNQKIGLKTKSKYKIFYLVKFFIKLVVNYNNIIKYAKIN